MAETLKEKLSALSGKLKVGGAEVSRKASLRMNSMGDKMRKLFQVPTEGEKLVMDATAEELNSPDWGKNLAISDLVNDGKLSGQDVVRAMKKRLLQKSTVTQFLALCLAESCVKNCEKMFSEVASERLLDEMVKLVDDPLTVPQNREKALRLMEAWGEATEELHYLPIFEETYKSLKSRGVRFPGRDAESLAPVFTPRSSASTVQSTPFGGGQEMDLSHVSTAEAFDVARNSMELLSTVMSSSSPKEALQEELTATLAEQCRQSQFKVQQIIEKAGENEALLFEALNINDEIQRLLSKYEESFGCLTLQTGKSAEPAVVNAEVINYEEEVVAGGQEDMLVRNRPLKYSNLQSSLHGDGLADLDEMVFGKKSWNDDEEIGKKRDAHNRMTF